MDGKYLTRSITNVPIPKNDPALRVLCEATENVTLNFINFLPFKRRQVPYYNDSSTFPHTSRIILRNEWFSNFSTVECLTVQDERVLRVWTYVKKGEKGIICILFLNMTFINLFLCRILR